MIELEIVGKIRHKFNQAIKANIKQISGLYNSQSTAFCAIGLMSYWNENTKEIPLNELDAYNASCTSKQCISQQYMQVTHLIEIIIHMNDDHKWSFRYIRNQLPKMNITKK